MQCLSFWQTHLYILLQNFFLYRTFWSLGTTLSAFNSLLTLISNNADSLHNTSLHPPTLRCTKQKTNKKIYKCYWPWIVASVLLLIRAGLRAPPRVPGLRLSKAPLQVQKRSHSLYCHVHISVILTTYQIDNKILKIIKKLQLRKNRGIFVTFCILSNGYKLPLLWYLLV